MTRGNQRDLAREKAAKKAQDLQRSKGAAERDGNKGMSLEARKQRDADLMREKQKLKDEKAAAAQASGSGTKK